MANNLHPVGSVNVALKGQEPGSDGRWVAVQNNDAVEQWSAKTSFFDYAGELKAKIHHRTKTWTWFDWLSYFIPCLQWIRTYKAKWLIKDLIAGISVGFMVVPQGMSYASTAGVPSIYGLYGAFLPCMVYGLVGSSRQLAVGPVAVTSLLIFTRMEEVLPCHKAITNYNQPKGDDQVQCMEQYTRAVIQVAFIVAVLYTAIGVFRLGWLTKFLGHPVIGGFTSGAAITIGLGQVQYILGYSVKPTDVRMNLYLTQYFDRVNNLKWQEFIMGMCLVGVMVFFRETHRIVPWMKWVRSCGPIACVIIGLAVSYIGNIGDHNMRLVGPLPAGLPSCTISWWAPMDGPTFGELLPTAIVVMFVDLLESTSIARAMARKNGYELVYNREIIGLGLANFAGALSNAYTTTGSFSRSAVNNQSGAQSPLSQFVCAWTVGFVLIFLTPLFQHLPYNVLGAVICVSLTSLFEYEQAIYLWKVNKLDLLGWCAAFFGVLFYSVEVGLAIAVGLALLIALYNFAFPRVVTLGQIPNTTFHRNTDHFPAAEPTPGILEFRVDAPLFYGNVVDIQDKFERAVKEHSAWSAQVTGGAVPKTRFVVWDLTPITYADSMGLHLLEDTVFFCIKHGITLYVSNPGKQLVRDWTPINYPGLVGKENIYVETHHAVLHARAQLAAEGQAVAPVRKSNKGWSPSTSISGSASEEGGVDGKKAIAIPTLSH